MPCSPLHDPAFPDRPAHPDFARLSEIILQLDATLEEAGEKKLDEDAMAKVFRDLVSQNIDQDSIMYLAQQRAMRTITVGQMTGILKPDARVMLNLVALLGGMYTEAFIVGARFAERKGREKG